MLFRYDNYCNGGDPDSFVSSILSTFHKFTNMGYYRSFDDNMKYVIVKGYNGAYDEATPPIYGRDLDTRLRPILEDWADSIIEDIGSNIVAPISIVWDGESFSIGYKIYKIEYQEIRSRAQILIVPSHEAYDIQKVTEKEEAAHE